MTVQMTQQKCALVVAFGDVVENEISHADDDGVQPAREGLFVPLRICLLACEVFARQFLRCVPFFSAQVDFTALKTQHIIKADQLSIFVSVTLASRRSRRDMEGLTLS